MAQEYVEFDSPDGHGTGAGTSSTPRCATGRLPGILVIHENRCLTPHIEDIARRMALDQFVAFAPVALFPLRGYPGNEDNARQLFSATRPGQDPGGLRRGCRLPSGAAGVPFHGSTPNLEDVPRNRCPMMVQSAETDPRINASWPDDEKALRAAGVAYQRPPDTTTRRHGTMKRPPVWPGSGPSRSSNEHGRS